MSAAPVGYPALVEHGFVVTPEEAEALRSFVEKEAVGLLLAFPNSLACWQVRDVVVEGLSVRIVDLDAQHWIFAFAT